MRTPSTNRKTIRRGSLLVAVALASLGVAAGCGDDDDAVDASADAPTKTEFIAQVDQICADSDKEIEAEAGALIGGQEPSPKELNTMAQEVLAPGIERQLEQLEAVTPPAGDEAEIDAMLAAAQEGVDALKADPSALTKGALDEGTQLAAAYGLEVCGSEE